MSDSHRSHIHLYNPKSILFKEDWFSPSRTAGSDKLEFDDIIIPPEQNSNGEEEGSEEDTKLPMPFSNGGINNEKTEAKKTIWKDLRIAELLDGDSSMAMNSNEILDFPDYSKSDTPKSSEQNKRTNNANSQRRR